MDIYILIFSILFVALAIVGHFLRNAKDFKDTGYPPQCFDCNRGDCEGCRYADAPTEYDPSN